MQKVVLATANPHKLEEINAIAKDYAIEFELAPDGFNPIEDGKTFEENSAIKAKTASKLTNAYALADDTGLCINYLNGAPGIYSARYANTQSEKIARILSELKGVPKIKRTAHFECVMTLTSPDGEIVHTTKGIVNGHIIEEAKGINGFGYDPIFYVDEIKKTMAEMSANEKNTISHRALALVPMLKYLEQKLQ